MVTVDEKGNVTIVSDNEYLYSSKVLKKPLVREDLERIEGLSKVS